MSVIHGGLDERELRALGIDPASVIDLSANLHPAGPSDGVLDAARSARFDRYPSADATPLREAIARHEGVPTASGLPTPGATAAIHLLARALLRPGRLHDHLQLQLLQKTHEYRFEKIQN